MRIIFLGTAGSVPWRNRNLPAILVNDSILLDCGEGVTRTLVEKGLINSVERVYLTHLHGDHVSGLPMLIWYYALKGRKKTLTVASVAGLAEFLDKVLTAYVTPMHRTGFLHVEELKPGQCHLNVKVGRANHTVDALAFRIDFGRVSICYTGDTSPSYEIARLAEGCDLLIHDATFPTGMEKEALQVGHSTPAQAAEIAEKAKVKILALIHLPFYYYEREDIAEEFVKSAKEVFSGEVIAPKDGDELEL